MSDPRDDPEGSGRLTILVPAYREAERVARVVRAARDAGLGRVLVIDDGSDDGTAAAARAAGAEVLRLPENRGKGGALKAGAEAATTPVVVLLDADLVGLRPDHVRALARPVLEDRADMTRGVFAGARWSTTAAQRLAPQLGGQRALRRDLLLRVPRLGDTRYGVEIGLSETAREEGWRCLDVPLEDVTQVMKEEKLGLWRGVRARLAMYRDIVRTWTGRWR